ncbi:MAG: helix-turn-helix domain-containing protein [Gemmatimonadaceae bacterium]|nr:helix-turn-helix domain-containing protein [Gemmatimonadaceae bacterium]
MRAGLTQRELARRAATAQSVVARIESGMTSPTWETLARLLAAAGFELETALRPGSAEPSHMLGGVSRILRLTPEQRLVELSERLEIPGPGKATCPTSRRSTPRLRRSGLPSKIRSRSDIDVQKRVLLLSRKLE